MTAATDLAVALLGTVAGTGGLGSLAYVGINRRVKKTELTDKIQDVAGEMMTDLRAEMKTRDAQLARWMGYALASQQAMGVMATALVRAGETPPDIPQPPFGTDGP